MKITAISQTASDDPFAVYKTDEPLSVELLEEFRKQLSGHKHLPQTWSIEGGMLKADTRGYELPSAEGIETLNRALRDATGILERDQKKAADDRQAFLDRLSQSSGLPLEM